ASLLLAHRPQGRLLVILGSGKLAASRARTAIEVGAIPLVVPLETGDTGCTEIQEGVRAGRVSWKEPPGGEQNSTEWGEWLDDVDGEENKVFALCVTDTLHSGDEDAAQHHHTSCSSSSLSSLDRATLLAQLCRRRRIPINVADRPTLCDFSFPATHRFALSSSQQGGSVAASPLQIAVTTNGRGCRLAGRIRREIVSALPRNVGDAVQRVGQMRDLAKGNSVSQVSVSSAAGSQGARDYISAKPQPQPQLTSRAAATGTAAVQEDDLSFDSTPLNSPVPQLSRANSRADLTALATHLSSAVNGGGSSARQQQREEEERAAAAAVEQTKRRMRWVAQISEYWPIEYLGGMSEEQMQGVLRSFDEKKRGGSGGQGAPQGEVQAQANGHGHHIDADEDERRGRSIHASTSRAHRARSQHSLSLLPPPPPLSSQSKGQIYLIGSGPGHPGLLTSLALSLLTSPSTHLILSDKLVPAPILRLIPSSTPLVIARKFPGNAEGAQSELIELALSAALKEGKNVVRLKQGDPFVYGRGGEEVLAFRRAGLQVTVVPGISSALAGPLMLGLPVTQRGAADSLVLCTGVGRGGKQVRLPGYERGRTLLVLMGVARLEALLDVLTSHDSTGRAGGKAYPLHLPIALVERASSPDQRLVASTLEGIREALDHVGEQRPPGMMMIGWSVLSLMGGEEGNVDVLADGAEAGDGVEDEHKDRQRVERWLDVEAVRGGRYVLREGLDAVYSQSLR
ncbi:hypothetical protein BDZ90DRAFT_205772, partial [Jaminaea rosea]